MIYKSPLFKELFLMSKRSGIAAGEKFYTERVLTSTESPICIVTSKKIPNLARYKEVGRFYSTSIRFLYKVTCNGDLQEAQQKLSEYQYIVELDDYFANWRTLSRSLSVYKFSQLQREEVYNKYFLLRTKCRLENCNNTVPLSMAPLCACSAAHYNKSNTLNNTGITEDDYKFICLSCNKAYRSPNHITRHIKDEHNLTEVEYYHQHVSKSNITGACKWCNAPTAFRSINHGYCQFCHNSECNVRYHNLHEARAASCAYKISKSQKQNLNNKNQKGYWTKKGFTEDQAKEFVRQRQTTNSVEAIMKRNRCSIEEAINRRKAITKKWLESYPRANYSRISQELFWSIYSKVKDIYKTIYFATIKDGVKVIDNKNYEFKVEVPTGYRKVDFYIRDVNKVIEFDGSYWHSEACKNVQFTAERDCQRKRAVVEALKCELFVVKESDYMRDKERIVKECVNFLLINEQSKNN